MKMRFIILGLAVASVTNTLAQDTESNYRRSSIY
jgi:hypothetical protein